MRVGDVGTELTFDVKDQDGNPVGLAMASRVQLVMQLASHCMERDCVVVSATQGQVRYVISAGDLQKPGTLDGNKGDV